MATFSEKKEKEKRKKSCPAGNEELKRGPSVKGTGNENVENHYKLMVYYSQR